MLHNKIGNNVFLDRSVDLYSHDYYYGFRSTENTLRYINYLKNDCRDFDVVITQCEDKAASVLSADLSELVRIYGPLTVCGIPRSKREDVYHSSMMGFKRALHKAVAMNQNLHNGIDYIVRHTNTLCTHRSYFGYGGDGESPRRGLMRDTCHISAAVAEKNIILVDDIYTPSVGIDEDGVQALFEAGARNVIMYTFGYTVNRRYCKCA